MAVARETGGAIPNSSDAWRDALLALADGTAAAWHLVVEDLARPAFLQPPVPEEDLDDAGFKADMATPDLLDILVTSKNHDVKMERIVSPRLEHWIYTLIALQTTVGGLGRGNYGVIRMNSFYGNRPMVGLAPDLSWGARFRRDLRVLLDARADVVDRHEYDPEGIALVWTEPLDGAKGSASTDRAVSGQNVSGTTPQDGCKRANVVNGWR